MGRYLLYFSYIGTHFKGAQRQSKAGECGDLISVQGVIDRALGNFFGAHKRLRTYLSSRTDTGTHAYVNTAHVDLNVKNVPSNSCFVYGMNKELRKLNVTDLRVNNVRKVPCSFHCRHHVRQRLYMYRLAVINPSLDYKEPIASHHENYLPMSELCRVHAVRPNFNSDVFQRVLALYRGEHDFASFMGSPVSCAPDINTVKMLDTWMQAGRPMVDRTINPMYDNLSDFYEVYFASRSFLYRQVRRLMGAAIRVAEGRMTFEQISYMLNNPGTDSWDPRINLAPACGLYLSDICYNSTDLESCEKVDETSE